MKKTMKAAVLHAVSDLRYEDVAFPTVGEGEVLLKVMAAGVCGIGVGGAIVDKKKIAAGDFAGITEAALAYTSQLN